MAFKPFEYFRKRQKVFLAGLTLLAMFSFVVLDMLAMKQPGGGSLWGRRIKNLFGYGDFVATVNGTGLEYEQIATLHRQRQAALRFLQAVEIEGLKNAYLKANLTNPELVLLNQATFQERQMEMFGQGAFEPANMPRIAARHAQTAQNEEQRKRWQEIEKKLGNEDLRKNLLAPSGTLCAGLLRALRQVQTLSMFTQALPRNTPFLADFSAEGLAEFVAWQRKADDLGVVLSPAKIKEDLVQAGFNSLQNEDLVRVARDAKLGMNTDGLYQALAEELRVMIARGVLLGPTQQGGWSEMIQATPYDLWKAYVEVRTSLDVGILPIPVDNAKFLQEVPDPTDAQVAEFFAKYKDQEPDPKRDTPGFRVPRMYQLSFVYGDLKLFGDTRKFYEQWARAQDLIPAVLAGGLADVLQPPATLAEAAARYERDRPVKYTHSEDAVLLTAGKPEAPVFYVWPAAGATEKYPTAAQLERQQVERLALPAALVATAGVDLTSLATVAQLIKPGPEKLRPAQGQGLAVATLVGGLSQGLPGLLGFQTGLPRLANRVTAIPYAQVAPGIVDELNDERLRRLIEADLRTLKADLEDYYRYQAEEFKVRSYAWKQTKISNEAKGQPVPAFEPPLVPGPEFREKYRKWKAGTATAAAAKPGDKKAPPEKAPVPPKNDPTAVPLAKFLEDYAKPRGLTVAGMKEPRSRQNLFKETGDTPLGTLVKPLLALNRMDDNMMERELLEGGGLYEGKVISAPMQMPREFVLLWRTAETEARTPKLDEPATAARVRRAWKVEQAREVAQRSAQRLADQIKGKPDGFQTLMTTRDYGIYTEDKLSRFRLSTPIQQGPVVQYLSAPQPLALDNPTNDSLDQILTKLQKPGDVCILTNEPKTHYYVVFLKERTQPQPTSEADRGRFDLEVISPAPDRQMQVDSMPLAKFVLREAARKYNQGWEQFFKDRTKFDEKLAKQVDGTLRSNSGGGGGEF